MTTSHPTDDFTFRFTATPRGARLARRLATHRLHIWGHHYGSETNDAVALVVADLAANSVTHGAVRGRGALLRLSRERDGLIRVEVSDTRGERVPAPAAPNATAVAGRGLMIVEALAEDWGVRPSEGAPGKIVWACLRPSGAPG
ncbi:ATP-binding protein [Streptomyces sp. NPDC094448]|uniref:ATP-binding protein n=1 Tax=Streptomyces sp. NPDC094448 TaxID=3366063 RepID=UPI003818A5A9